MLARVELAALDHNANSGREKASVKKPNYVIAQEGNLQYRTAFSKQTKQWIVKPIYKAKSNDYVKPMMEATVQRKLNGEAGKPQILRILIQCQHLRNMTWLPNTGLALM